MGFMNTMVCPKCKKEFEISEAISHKVTEEILAKNNTKHKEELEKQKREAEEKAQLKIKNEIDKYKSAQKNSDDRTQKELLEAQNKIKQLEKKGELTKEETKEREERILEEATKEAQDKSRLDKLSYEKKISDMQKALEEAQRKGNQGSQQLQGEVLELDLEEKLKAAFPGD